ncbi:MAG: ERF family protein [Actinomycetota bacterium]|nr:ERF family protein [Actinomycetota bacterium]
MRSSEQIDQLAAALAAAQAAFPPVKKDRTATVPTKTGGTYSYHYADLTDLLDAVRPVLTANGLAVVQGGTGERMVTRLVHTSGQWIESDGTLPATQATPQGLGSAITYARRYWLSALLGIAAEEDDDGALGSDAPKPARRKSTETGEAITEAQLRKVLALFNDLGILNRTERLDYTRTVVGRDVGSSRELTKKEASALIEAISSDVAALRGEES